jgi:hypothetical protein
MGVALSAQITPGLSLSDKTFILPLQGLPGVVYPCDPSHPKAPPPRRVRPTRGRAPAGYPSGEGRMYAEDLIVKIEGPGGTMIVSA